MYVVATVSLLVCLLLPSTIHHTISQVLDAQMKLTSMEGPAYGRFVNASSDSYFYMVSPSCLLAAFVLEFEYFEW
jgi:hypothetical protein